MYVNTCMYMYKHIGTAECLCFNCGHHSVKCDKVTDYSWTKESTRIILAILLLLIVFWELGGEPCELLSCHHLLLCFFQSRPLPAGCAPTVEQRWSWMETYMSSQTVKFCLNYNKASLKVTLQTNFAKIQKHSWYNVEQVFMSKCILLKYYVKPTHYHACLYNFMARSYFSSLKNTGIDLFA